ncbi:MAG: efflux RND transporter periplasmic adaptor subunit [Gammaproteobacteria bacterium]|nr:efflux RND transporter periplasmic adaptor subunit [Gammaproteobacteria bacterium]
MNKQTVMVAILVALAVGGGGGYWFASRMAPDAMSTAGDAKQERKALFYRNPMNPAITSPVPAQDEMGMDYIPVYADDNTPKERKALFYRNPMNPAITSPVPAQDEMGMDYIPVYADEDNAGDAPAGTVKIDPVTVQNIGVRTAIVEQRTLSRHIRAVGRVAYNEERLSRLHPKTEGWIKELRIDKTGSPVKKNDILLSIYAPQLVASQEEYLLAMKSKQILADSPFDDIRQGAIDLEKTARERLELLDMAEHQIRELERTHEIKKYLHIHSPFNGIAIKIGAREGQYVTPKTELYMLADLSKIWVYVDIYEYELPWITVGDQVEMELTGVPGRVFTGRLAYIYPYAEARTRTIRVRLVFDNKELLLKPDMFAEVSIAASRQIAAVVVPAEAVVRSGTREQVFVVRGAGKFEPREVKIGITTSGVTQILTGLKVGEEVVTSSQFLIDSESKLREATAKMMEILNAGQGDNNSASVFDDMSMDDMSMDDMSMDDMSPEKAK